jgi:hypothetical protein
MKTRRFRERKKPTKKVTTTRMYIIAVRIMFMLSPIIAELGCLQTSAVTPPVEETAGGMSSQRRRMTTAMVKRAAKPELKNVPALMSFIRES